MLEAETSREAYERSLDRAEIVEEKIVVALRAFRDGLTPDEIAELVEESVLTVRPTATRMRQAGAIHRTGETRLSALGRRAFVVALA